MRLPVEIRLLIYDYLFDDGGHKILHIRNVSRFRQTDRGSEKQRRSTYQVMERSFHHICFETTYCLDGSNARFDTAIMSVNRQVYHETSHLLYGEHAFDFGADLEAVVPFLEDRLPQTRALIREISVQKRPVHADESGKYDWAKMCRYLGGMDTLCRLRLVVEGGRPAAEWDGPRELSPSDLRLLWLVKHHSMEWATNLAEAARGVREVEIVASVGYLAPPKTTAMLLYAAFSASITTSLVEFLRSDLGVPATAGRAEAGNARPNWVEGWVAAPGTP